MNTPHTSQDKLFPDQKPVRVTVPVTPEVQAAFQRLAASSGMSTGKAMGEWLADTLDGVKAMADLLERARAKPRQVVRELNSYALGLTDVTAELMSKITEREGKGAAAGGVQAKRKPPAVGTFPPRTVIRGGKSSKQPKTGGKP